MVRPMGLACLEMAEWHFPLFACHISAGFPSPADDYIESHLDLNRYLIHQPSATFCMCFEGDPMIDSGLRHGDMLIVDRSILAADNKIVVAAFNGDIIVRRVKMKGRYMHLLSENPNCPTLSSSRGAEFEILGAVTYFIRDLLERRSL